jgi:hypothetical protein
LLLAAPVIGAEPDFARDVRPILAQYCFKCHGPDEKARKAELRLDDRQQALDHGAFVPGKPADSELVSRVFSSDSSQRMPPPSTKMALTDLQKQTLKDWIAAGANYKPHWAFVKPARAAFPAGRSAEQANPIDSFVLARLAHEGLKMAPEADRHTLIRRVSLDLVGLPPTPAEVSAFIIDTSPDAYLRLVDRLLASPAYGERWARRWLDLARYADTNGYEKDRPRSIWPYRDWVINALNADMPFDEFTIKQLAGDMLPGATEADRIATGFHRNTMLNEEGGIDPLEFRFHAMTDRVATTGTVWLGLTVGCAQCHTHKFDPIPQKEYYQFLACLNNTDEPQLTVRAPAIEARRKQIVHEIAHLIDKLPERFPAEFGVGDARKAKIEAAFSDWLQQERQRVAPWQILRPKEIKTNLPHLTLQADDSIFVSGDLTKSDEYTLKFAGDFSGVTAVRVEALPDARLPNGGPGAVYYEGAIGDFTLSEIRASTSEAPLKFSKATHSFAAGNYTSQAAIDGDPQTGWSVAGGQGRRHVAVFVFDKPLASTHELTLNLLFERHFAADIGRFRISVTKAANPQASAAPPELEQLLLLPAAKVDPEQLGKLRQQFYLETPHLAAARKTIEDLRKQLPPLPTTLVMRERPHENPRATYVHNRGEFLQPKERVEPGTFSFLPKPTAPEPMDRLAFAHWLVSREQPLTARVTVNRQWAAIFGRGLVRTTEDFGYQGELPSHPELLDWLATEFMDQGWSLKKLHRLIVTSATYRQDSRVRPELLTKDANNILLARGPRVRLEAELVRDSALRVADLLSGKMGGASVYPPQLPSVTTEGAYGAMQWRASAGEDRYRRSLYTFSKRTAPFALYTTFDAPSGEACVARRDVSNTPMHALFLLNDITFVEASQKLGRTFANLPGPIESRMIELFRRFVCRAPSTNELEKLTSYFNHVIERCANKDLDARKIAGAGSANDAERAAWTSVARLLFNLDEFVTKN